MRVETQGDKLLVSWNRHMADIQSAKYGVLAIHDGPKRRDIDLQRDAIANGSMVYKPTTDDVTFRLEINTGAGTPIAGLVRVFGRPTLASRPAVAPQSLLSTSTNVSQTSIHNAGGRGIMRMSSSPAVKSPAHSTEQPEIAQTASLPDLRFDLGQTSAPLTSSLVSTPPPDFVSAQAQRPESITLERHDPVREETVNSKRPLNTPLTKNYDAKISPIYVPPRPVKQVVPNPRIFGSPAVSVPTQVEVQVQIDAKGRVIHASVIRTRTNAPGPLLAVQSIAAARQWIFEPAKMHGNNVPSEYRIQFSFRPKPL